jgi:hypothetical protein
MSLDHKENRATSPTTVRKINFAILQGAQIGLGAQPWLTP